MRVWSSGGRWRRVVGGGTVVVDGGVGGRVLGLVVDIGGD